jgi:hypothetical protein
VVVAVVAVVGMVIVGMMIVGMAIVAVDRILLPTAGVSGRLDARDRVGGRFGRRDVAGEDVAVGMGYDFGLPLSGPPVVYGLALLAMGCSLALCLDLAVVGRRKIFDLT